MLSVLSVCLKVLRNIAVVTSSEVPNCCQHSLNVVKVLLNILELHRLEWMTMHLGSLLSNSPTELADVSSPNMSTASLWFLSALTNK